MIKHCTNIFITSIFLVLASHAAAEPLSFCYENQHFPPFNIGTGPQPKGEAGVLADIVNISADLVSIDITLQRKPWKRCQFEIKQGIVDGLFAFIYSAERSNWAQFPMNDEKPDSRFMHESEYLIFTHVDSNVSWDGETLSPITAQIQSVPGYVADNHLQLMGFQPLMEIQPNKALSLLAQERLDGYIMDATLGKRLVQEFELTDKITTLPIPFMVQHWYVAFSKQSYAKRPEDIERFWTMLETVRQESLETLIQQYQ